MHAATVKPIESRIEFGADDDYAKSQDTLRARLKTSSFFEITPVCEA